MSNEYIKYENVEWSLPLLFQYEPVYGALCTVYRELNMELPKVNLFGSPANIWSGGRPPIVSEEFQVDKLLRLFKYCSCLNISPTFTFTAVNLTKEDIKNEYANLILDTAIEVGARYIVYDDRLRDHIKSKDPNAVVIASVIKPSFRYQGPEKLEKPTVEKETEYYNQLLKEYDIIVVRPEYSKTALYENPNLIDDLSRIEVLINQPCMFNCPRNPDHYKFFEKRKQGKVQGSFRCILADIDKDKHMLTPNNCTHSEEVVHKLVDAGVKHLKLQGRSEGYPMIAMLSLMYGQMFNQTGNSFMTAQNVLRCLDHEIMQFSAMLQDMN